MRAHPVCSPTLIFNSDGLKILVCTLQMGAPKLCAALLPERGGQRIRLVLNLPEASIDHFSPPEEAASRCKSNLSVLLIPDSKTEPPIDFISSPVLLWQVSPSPGLPLYLLCMPLIP